MYALKCYGPLDVDGRDRLGHEFNGLRFLAATGVADVVPRPVAVDRANRCALYEWVEGHPVAQHDAGDVDAMLALLARLHALRLDERAAALGPATEAVLQRSDLLEQIDARVNAFTSIIGDEPELKDFLAHELEPELTRRRAAASPDAADGELARRLRTLSPSDFGFHNALRRSDGSLTFIDFEYFGWDDPAKLIADVLWHPAMDLSREERRHLLAGALRIYAEDRRYAQRLAQTYPLFGIRWALIMLNEFIPRRWTRRAFARSDADVATAKTIQLRKARATLARVRQYRESELLP